MTATDPAPFTDTWTKIEVAHSHWIADLDADEYQKAYAKAMEVDPFTYEVPGQESDGLSTVITVTFDGVDYDIRDYVDGHPNDERFSQFEAVDATRAERFGT